MNRNIRDVLMHLHHWYLMIFDGYSAGMKGEKPDMPAKGHTWRTTPELNRWSTGKSYCKLKLIQDWNNVLMLPWQVELNEMD